MIIQEKENTNTEISTLDVFQFDVLVIGGGIAGVESSLKLADMGHKVLIVEKEASIGGKMILLS